MPSSISVERGDVVTNCDGDEASHSNGSPDAQQEGPEEDETPPTFTAQAEEEQESLPTDDTNYNILKKGFSSTSDRTVGSMLGPKAVDILLAEELNRMSPDERERAFQDLHCISSYIPGESPESINEAMEEVRDIISKKDASERAACDIAQKQNPRLFYEPRFMLRFLRAAMYEPEDCARRVVSYFELKKALFGTKKLANHLALDDLDEADMRCLNSGIMQILPARDRAGRAILFWNICLRDSHSQLSKQRVQFYGLQAGSESAVVQQRGMVILSWNHGPGKISTSEMAMSFKNPAMVAMHSVRCEAFHFCVDSEDNGVVSAALMSLVGKHTRVRFRTHSGSLPDIRNSLRTFGVPVDVLPFTEGGKFLFHNGGAWLKARRELEASVVIRIEGASALAALKRKPQQEQQAEENADVPSKRTTVAEPATRKKAKTRDHIAARVVAFASEASKKPATKRPNTETPQKPGMRQLQEARAPRGKAKKQDEVVTAVEKEAPATAPTKLTKTQAHRGQYIPNDNDVVLGKGRLIQDMPGNVKLRNMVKAAFTKYESFESNQDKTFLAMEIVADIKDGGGRFIKEDATAAGGYKEVDSQVARDKVASTFHSQRRFKRKRDEAAATAASAAPSKDSRKVQGDVPGSSENAARKQVSNTLPNTSMGMEASRSQLLVRANQIAANGFGFGPIRFNAPTAPAGSSSTHGMSATQLLTQVGFTSVMPGAAANAALRTREEHAWLLGHLGLQSPEATHSESLAQARAHIYAERAQVGGWMRGQHLGLSMPSSAARPAERVVISANGFVMTGASSGSTGKRSSDAFVGADSSEDLQARLYREMEMPGI